MTEPEKTTESRPVEPVQVAIVATGDKSRLSTGTEAETPGAHQPNIIVNVVGPLFAVSIRFANTFLTVLLGLVTGALASHVIPYHDFIDLVLKCAGLSVAGAGIGLIKDLITIFGKLEGKYPLATGNI